MTMRFIRSITLVLMLLCGLILPPSGQTAQGGSLASVLSAQPSVVRIKAEAAAIFKGKDAIVGRTPSGRLIIQKTAKPVYHKRNGAGLILHENGLIVTNAHTVKSAGRITVTLIDGTDVIAKVQDMAPEIDLALIKIEPPYPLEPFRLSDSDKLQLKSDVYSIGTSEMLMNTVTGGFVKGIGIEQTSKHLKDPLIDLIEVSFKVYQGDSGSPILGSDGKLLGLIVAGNQKTRTSYAIPSNKIKVYVESLKKT